MWSSIRILSWIAVLAAATSLFAQPPSTSWVVCWPSAAEGGLLSLSETLNGDIVCGGYESRRTPEVVHSAFVTRLDRHGRTEWYRTYSEGVIHDAQVFTTGDIWFVGQSLTTDPSGGGWLGKLNPEGEPRGHLNFTHDDIWTLDRVFETLDGDLVVTGIGPVHQGEPGKPVIVRFDLVGNRLWTVSPFPHGWWLEASIRDIERTASGDFVFIGNVIDSSDDSVFVTWDWLMRVTPDGDTTTLRKFPAFTLHGIETLPGGDLYLTGTEGRAVFLERTDSLGVERKRRLYSIPFPGWMGPDIERTLDDGCLFIMAGNDPVYYASYVFKVDSLFDVRWTLSHGELGIDEWPMGALAASDGSYYIASSTFDWGADLELDMCVLKTTRDPDIPYAPRPPSFELSQNYPNPFNASTIIRFYSRVSQPVEVSLWDVLGRRVAVLFQGAVQPGDYSAVWDASSAPSGIYFYRLESGDFTVARKMVVVR